MEYTPDPTDGVGLGCWGVPVVMETQEGLPTYFMCSVPWWFFLYKADMKTMKISNTIFV